MYKEINLSELEGEILTHVDVDEDGTQILLTTQSGRQISIDHTQKCCEEVKIVDQEGDWHSLIGKPLLLAAHDESQEIEDVPEQVDTKSLESFTTTTLTFRVDGATVVSRWFGESNGYYSETVEIADVTKKRK